MDATNFDNNNSEVTEKFEHMEDVSRVTSTTSSTQSPRTKNYFAKKSGGVQKRAFVPTVPKPFKFRTESRANNSRNKENSPKSPFIPLALSVQQFLEKPTKLDIKEGLKSGKLRSNTLTVPKSPYLRTKYRSKPTAILSTDEHKIREMQNYKFKANPVDRKIFGNRNFGIQKVQKPKLTEPYSPAITKSKPPRPKSPSPHSGEKYQRESYDQVRKEREYEKEITQFYAQPLPNFEPEFPRKLEYPPPTEPIGFSLLTNTCMEESHIYDEHRRLREKEAEARNTEEIRRLSVPRHYSPIIVQPSSKKPTRPISPMIGGNYEYSSTFDLDNMDDISNASNVESLGSILYSPFKADQITNAALTPIDECETEFQDIIMTDSVSSEQVQAEEDIMKYIDLD